MIVRQIGKFIAHIIPYYVIIIIIIIIIILSHNEAMCFLTGDHCWVMMSLEGVRKVDVNRPSCFRLTTSSEEKCTTDIC